GKFDNVETLAARRNDFLACAAELWAMENVGKAPDGTEIHVLQRLVNAKSDPSGQMKSGYRDLFEWLRQLQTVAASDAWKKLILTVGNGGQQQTVSEKDWKTLIDPIKVDKFQLPGWLERSKISSFTVDKDGT